MKTNKSTAQNRYNTYIGMYDKLPTMLDQLGLVDARATVAALQKQVGDTNWHKLPDTHHLYWPASCYPKNTLDRQFRELAVHKIILPRDFHEYLHEVTEPPPKPDDELMYYHITSHDSAKMMFESAQNIIQRQREIDRLLGRRPGKNRVKGGMKSRVNAISRSKTQFDMARHIFQAVPDEARVVSVDLNANLGRIARQLGSFALKPKRHFNQLQQA